MAGKREELASKPFKIDYAARRRKMYAIQHLDVIKAICEPQQEFMDDVTEISCAVKPDVLEKWQPSVRVQEIMLKSQALIQQDSIFNTTLASRISVA